MLLKEEKKGGIAIILVMLLVSGLLGNLLGMLVGAFFPQGILYDILARQYECGLNPPVTLNLWILSLSAGFLIRLNGCSLLLMFLGMLLYKKA